MIADGFTQASKSKIAQERLASLEKASAPFEDQLIEGAKFIGVDLETVRRTSFDSDTSRAYHGREEWLLRWILKKLADKKDATPQQTPDAWWLLGYLIKTIPRTTAARLLVEKKFTEILRSTLEGVREAADKAGTVTEEKPEEPLKNSKKRKRTPDTTRNNWSQGAISQQMKAIHAVVSFITSAAETTASQEDGRDLAFTAEYMKTTIRTSAKESATILGLWFSLSSDLSSKLKDSSSWLSPFIELWQARIAGENDLLFFSSHCTKWLLQLLQRERWKADLEQLAARNILIPTRSDWLANPESTLLSTLTKLFVIQDPASAPIFFDIAIRSIQTHGNGRRQANDDSWLQVVFATLQEGFVKTRHKYNCASLHLMLLSAIRFKLKLDLQILRKVTSQYALAEERPDWALVAALLELDGNVFLIPYSSEDLLSILLSNITKLPFKDEYERLEIISSDILIPLVNEFVKARDLTGFLRHWHAQLVNFEELRAKSDIALFSPWEEDALQKELPKIFEPSLTLRQITQILEWFESEVDNSPNAVSVILQAMAGTIANSDVVDAVGIRLYRTIRKSQLDIRYRWRSWSILSQTLDWAQSDALEELELLCKSDANLLSDLRKVPDTSFVDERGNLETLEKFRSMCALWNAAKTGSTLKSNAEIFVLEFMHVLNSGLNALDRKLLDTTSNGLRDCDEPQYSPHRGLSWTLWSCVRILVVEYPKALT
jgi:nucleolar pre-ribosomal-associated protein 2